MSDELDLRASTSYRFAECHSDGMIIAQRQGCSISDIDASNVYFIVSMA